MLNPLIASHYCRWKMDENIKRRRNLSSSWFQEVQYIKSSGGFIHDSIEFTSNEREVKVVSDLIEKGTVLMRIPKTILINLSQVETTDIGKFLFRVLNVIKADELFHSKDDLLLALFLAFIDVNEDLEQHQGIKLYLNTLPSNTSYDNLPRRWKDDELECLPRRVKERAISERNGVHNDFQVLKAAYENTNQSFESNRPTWIFPSKDKFDQMLAAISSRAFHEYGDDGLDTLIPLLDLMNHKRGVGASSDVSYQRMDDGSIQVSAKCNLKLGTSLGITYGAKANQVLLLRYGFCLDDNIEPDGSSNDVVEFGLPAIELRSGPKSYTYGPFVKLLERFIPVESAADGENFDREHDSTDDGECCKMDDYLEFCDEEENDDCLDLYADRDDNEEYYDTNKSDEKSITCEAIDALMSALETEMGLYKIQGNELQSILEKKDGSRKFYSGLLIKSELRILRFYHTAAAMIKMKLNGGTYHTSSENTKIITSQAEELMRVFCLIRFQIE